MSKRILFVVAAVFLAGAGIFVRASSAHSSRIQADSIIKDDASGKATPASVASLKDFVGQHMGSSVSFTLKSGYDRAQAAAQTSASSTNAASQVYADAQRVCSGKSDSITQARCNQAYISQHLSTAPAPAPVTAPKLSDYMYAFAAPAWTPDLAGALLLGAVAAIIFGLFIGRSKGRR